MTQKLTGAIAKMANWAISDTTLSTPTVIEQTPSYGLRDIFLPCCISVLFSENLIDSLKKIVNDRVKSKMYSRYLWDNGT
jgi:hypothetical protein